MINWQIRWKLTVWNMAVLILILVGFASAMLLMLREHLYQRDDIVIAEEMKELLEEIGRHDVHAELTQQLEPRFAVHSHYNFQVVLPSGEMLFRSRFLSHIQLPLPDRPDELRGRVFQDIRLPQLGHYRLLTQAFRDANGKVLLAQVVTSRAALDREFRSYLWITLALLPVGALAALISGFLLAKWALAPIDRMTGIAERISAETLTERLKVTNAEDELGRLATTLNKMFDRLQRSIEEMRRFTADAAHELRLPLAVMRTEAEVVLRSTRSPAMYLRAVEINLEETKRLGDLVDQLLTLSRHDAGLPSQSQDAVQLDALIGDVGDRFAILAREKQIELEIKCDECVVLGDDIALSRLLFNLFDNAIRYTPAGGHVTSRTEIAAGKVRIVLQDSGIGISAEHLPHLFNRFYRAEYSRNRELGGSGLGLAICKSIVEAHRGEISVTSEPEGGAQFIVVLPLYTACQEATKERARSVHTTD